MSSLKFKCGYCRWVVWFDKNGQISHHPCLANHTELIMDKDQNLFINDFVETHVKSENNQNSTACVDDDNLIPIINDNSTSLSPVSLASSKSRKRKRIDLEKYDKVYEDEYDGISESPILTNIIENKYSKKGLDL
ncbi:uncharacterized protein LOC143905776 [Temnothorax americanus]|uniref:uncharacterized protein LOC143905776 n=1 Tax=Temnothorax americanus TaxID=1964332 RepID=UPI004068BF63